MSEIVLTEEEIKEIKISAIRNAVLRNPNVMSVGLEKTSILTISPKNGIIFIQGDSHTGFTHINERHNFWSEKNYWKFENEKTKLDDPSKFSRKSMPIVDYEIIADNLFSEENLNIKKNKRIDVFDMYSGFVEEENNGLMKYHMLLYKNTKILHTLFPNSKTHNSKKYINFTKGEMKEKLWSNPLIYTIAIPYQDNIGRVKYSFQITKEFENKLETGILINHKDDVSWELYEREFKDFDFENDCKSLEYADLSSVEKLIKKLEDEENNNNGC
jgi:hypothetical protein